MTATTLTLYLANVEQLIRPPAPILVDGHYFVRAPYDLAGGRLIGFSPASGFPIVKWAHDALTAPDAIRGLHANFIVAGRVIKHPLPVSEITIRQHPGSVQVVITDTRNGQQYRPYLGNDGSVAQRVADAWGRRPDYAAAILPAAAAAS
ncbi:hypothetical protein ACPW96_21635 [Micromonospora sp. DT81.3]|uniref:hypothetical protein n=1 Tax=Micromonospora sp. DT81.3 TaxID=3416523 RepID=UPI003CF3798D